MINLSLLDNFYPVTSYRRVQKEDELLYTVRSLVMVREPVARKLNEFNQSFLNTQQFLLETSDRNK